MRYAERNNLLSSENMKLKTKIMVLEKDNLKLQKVVEDESITVSQKLPLSGVGQLLARDKVKAADSSLKMVIKSLKK